jgi:hypothetical protein
VMACAVAVRDLGDEREATALLLERVAVRPDSEMLRAALTQIGAVSLLRSAPGGWRPPRA